MHQGDYSSYYQFPHHPNPNPNSSNPNPTDFPQPPYASAPPFNSGYASSDYPAYQSNYPPYPPNSDPAPPTAPTYNPPLSTTPPASNPSPLASFNQANPTLTSAPSFPPYDPHGAYQPPSSHPPYFQPYDQHQTAPSYAPPPPIPEVNSQPPFYSASYPQPGSYDNQYDNSMKFDHGGYFDDKYGGYNKTRSDLGSDPYGKRSESYSGGYGDDAYGDGVYPYQGPKVEPYGSRGTAPKSSASAMFDDYGRAVGFSSGKDSSGGSAVGSPKIVRAVPKADSQQDAKSGVQKFRVKILPESYGQSTMDVLCQIGLDGIRMLDPSTSRTLRIYSLESVTRCEVTDSSTLAFWSKSSVDIEPRRIRMQSNSYTTSTLLDTITAATVQIKEMGGSSRPSEIMKTAEQTAEKKGLTDWMNKIKPVNEEKDHWVPDEAVTKCTACGTNFGAFVRRHHCRNCGDIFCDKCTQGRIALTADDNAQPVRVCDRCMAEVTQRLSRSKEAASKPANLQSHEDLAKKLQEEMERNRRASSGSKTDGSGRRMKEVECPTCTVHLQVQVPSSGSETIECGVCQHPFLVSAH